MVSESSIIEFSLREAVNPDTNPRPRGSQCWCVPLRTTPLTAHSGFIQALQRGCRERNTLLQLLRVRVLGVWMIGDRKTLEFWYRRNIGWSWLYRAVCARRYGHRLNDLFTWISRPAVTYRGILSLFELLLGALPYTSIPNFSQRIVVSGTR